MKTLRLISAAVLISSTVAMADQPKMAEALENLRSARFKLEHAEHDKAGHRDEALRLVNAAIDEVEKGMHAGRHHHW